MSIIRRMTSHLDDAALAELWTNSLAEGVSVEHPHLEACAECRLRAASFSQWMMDVRADAIDEATEGLTTERLAAQQAQIFRRLEAAEHPARVITFPKVSATDSRPSPLRRWVAAAVAASFVAGLGLGQVLDLRHWSEAPATFPADRVAAGDRPTTGVGAVPASATINEELTLLELEEAGTPRYEVLRAYDTFTPRAADFVQASR